MSVTYTFQAQRITSETDGDRTIAVDPAIVSFTFPAGTTTIDYTIVGRFDFIPEIDILPEAIGATVDGTDVETLLDEFEAYTLIGRLEQPGGTTVFLDYLLERIDGSESLDYVFAIDGPALPTFSDPDAAEAFFERNEDNFSEIPAGSPFGPGQTIDLTTLSGVEISGDVTAPGPAPTPAPVPQDIFGTPGADELIGGGADDTIVGLGGIDEMTGGAGADNFVLFGRAAVPQITVTDFSQAEGDRLAFDDQLLGLGDRRIDVRDISVEDGLGLLRDGIVTYSGRTGLLTVDTDLDGTADATAQIDPGIALGFDDVVIF